MVILTNPANFKHSMISVRLTFNVTEIRPLGFSSLRRVANNVISKHSSIFNMISVNVESLYESGIIRIYFEISITFSRKSLYNLYLCLFAEHSRTL